MFGRTEVTGRVTFRVRSAWESGDGLVLKVEVAFEDLNGVVLCKVGNALLHLAKLQAGEAVKCGPVKMELHKLNLPGLDEAIERAVELHRDN